MLLISKFHKRARETCKTRDTFSEIFRKIQKRKLFEISYIYIYIYRKMLNSFLCYVVGKYLILPCKM